MAERPPFYGQEYRGVSLSLVYAYVERKQIPHYRMMGRSIRFRLSELAE